MNLKDVYLHGICICDNNDFTDTFSILEKILQSGSLLSLSLQDKYDHDKIGYNGLEYISICDFTKINDVYNKKKICINYNAFSYHIKRSLTLALSKENIETVKPILLEPYFIKRRSEREILFLINKSTRKFSDYPDELMVKNRISLNNLKFITIPVNYFMSNEKEENRYNMIVDLLRKTRAILKKYDKLVPLYDLDTMINLDDNIKVKELIKRNS